MQWPPVTLMPRQVWVLEHAPDVLSSVFRGEEGIDHDGPRLNGLFNKEQDDEIRRNLIGFHGGEMWCHIARQSHVTNQPETQALGRKLVTHDTVRASVLQLHINQATENTCFVSCIVILHHQTKHEHIIDLFENNGCSVPRCFDLPENLLQWVKS